MVLSTYISSQQYTCPNVCRHTFSPILGLFAPPPLPRNAIEYLLVDPFYKNSLVGQRLTAEIVTTVNAPAYNKIPFRSLTKVVRR